MSYGLTYVINCIFHVALFALADTRWLQKKKKEEQLR